MGKLFKKTPYMSHQKAPIIITYEWMR